MFTAPSVDESSLQEGTKLESKGVTGTKHTISDTISPPDTPAPTDTSSRSPPTSFTQCNKKSRMDSADDSIGCDANAFNGYPSDSRLSVIARGAAAAQPVNVSAKYDRQIRIWGDHGQAALTGGCVYIIGHSMTASEIAKNISLAGVGALVFVDTGCIVTEEMAQRQGIPPLHDFHNRPFCDAMAHWGKLFNPSATVSCLRLKSIDDLPDYIHQDVEGIPTEDRLFHKRPSCVVICNPEYVPGFEELIDKILPVPVITCTTIGLLAYSRICLPAVYPIIETHVEYAVDDLRLLEPFPGLLEIYSLLNFDELSHHDRHSVPWPLVVLHYLVKMYPHNNAKSLSAADRNRIKERIREVNRQDREHSSEDAENFQQAIKGLNAALMAEPGVPEKVQKILADKNVDESSDAFWLMCAGLRKFIASRSHLRYPLPLRGSIPDISASTVRFVALQEAYRRQADADAAEVYKLVLEAAEQRNVLPPNVPTYPDVQLFCRNASFLTVIRGVSIASEDVLSAEIKPGFESYLAMRAFDRFCTMKGRLPKGDDHDDMKELIGILTKTAPEGHQQTDLLAELVCGAQSPEVCAPVIGGILSHEVVKLITGQFVPVNNVLVFDGRSKAISTFSLSSRC